MKNLTLTLLALALFALALVLVPVQAEAWYGCDEPYQVSCEGGSTGPRQEYPGGTNDCVGCINDAEADWCREVEEAGKATLLMIDQCMQACPDGPMGDPVATACITTCQQTYATGWYCAPATTKLTSALESCLLAHGDECILF